MFLLFDPRPNNEYPINNLNQYLEYKNCLFKTKVIYS